MSNLEWKNESLGESLYKDGVKVSTIITHFYMKDQERKKRYEVNTLDYMSSWDGIYFDTVEEAKLETERVVTEKKLRVENIILEAREHWNGNIYFTDHAEKK